MKKYIFKIWYFLLLLTPLSVFAESSDTGDNSLGNFLHAFTPSTYSANDLSMNYLGQVFGSVGGVVSGSNGQLLGRLFEVFNNGLLVIAGLFLTYTIFKAVIDTANEGQLMGRNPKGGGAGWTAFRTAMGIGCLIPSKASGYCLIQVFFMWVVTQGIGLADMVWGRAIDYLAEEGGAVYVTNPYSFNGTTAENSNSTSLVTIVGNVLQSSICMYRLQNTLDANNQANMEASGGTATPNSTTVGSGWVTSSDGKTMTLSFGKNTGQYTSDGQVQWGNECGSYEIVQSDDYNPNAENSPLAYKQMALNQVVIDVAQVAKQTAQLETSDQISTVNDQSVTAMTNGSVDYTNIITPILKKSYQNGEAKARAQLEKARDQGWIVAGSYYHQLGEVNKEVQGDVNDTLPTWKEKDTGFPATSSGGDLASDTLVQSAMNAVASGYNGSDSYINQTIVALSEVSKNGDSKVKPVSPSKITDTFGKSSYAGGTTSAMWVLTSLVGIMNASAAGIAAAWEQVVNDKIVDHDPITVLQSFGNNLILIVTAVWLGTTLLVIASTAAIGVCTGATGMAEAMISGVIMFVPILITVLLALLTSGLVFSVYVPLIPFLIFFFATLGWFVLVLEAMIAAPLVAIGITHPEGHDILGKAEQALMMLLGAFLRPVMLLLGFLAAMIMVRISIQILNIGFRTVTDATIAHFNIFTLTGMLVVYTLIVMYVVQLVFELCISKIPAFASEWMNIRTRHDESRGLDIAKGGLDSAGGTMSEWGKSASQHVSQTGMQGVKSYKPKSTGITNNNSSPTPNPTPNP